MKNILFAGAAIIALAVGAAADCGDETWGVPPTEVHPDIASKTKQVLLMYPAKTAPASIHMYMPANGNFNPGELLSTTELLPISRAPVCSDDRHPLRGGRYPIYSIRGQYVEAVINAKTGATAWLSLPETNGRLIDLSSVTKPTAFNPDFSPTNQEVRVYPFPDDQHFPYTIFPKGAILKASGQEGDYLHLTAARWDEKKQQWEVVSVGWVRLRSPDGNLLLWPWYHDDC